MKVSSPESEELKMYFERERIMVKKKTPYLHGAARGVAGWSAKFKWQRSEALLSMEKELELLRQLAYEARPTWLIEWEKQRRRNGLDPWF